MTSLYCVLYVHVSRSILCTLDVYNHSLCSFVSTVPAGGCADNNGGCEVFCFSVPNDAEDGTRVQCGCPTGILLDDRSCNLCKER